jgi:hypothetical protein
MSNISLAYEVLRTYSGCDQNTRLIIGTGIFRDVQAAIM